MDNDFLFNDSSNAVIVETFIVTTEDGIDLNGDIYRPNIDKAVPVLFLRTPYGKHNINSILNPIMVARKNFAVVVQNVRGRYESQGFFEPFINEKNDGNISVKWLKKQKWCNKKVFTIGVSYEGFSAMVCDNKEIDAFVSILSCKNVYKYWFFENGLVKQSFVQAWSHSLAYTDTNRICEKDKKYIQNLANKIDSLYKHDIYDFPAAKFLTYYYNWVNPVFNEYWNNVYRQTDVKDFATPGYFLSGWYDIFCEGTIHDYLIACENKSFSHKLVIGPWGHTSLFDSLIGELDFGICNVSKYGFRDIINWLLSLDGNISNEVLVFLLGENKWITLEKWPPKCNLHTLYLSFNVDKTHSLTSSKPLIQNMHTLDFERSNVFPSKGGRLLDATTSYYGKSGTFNQNNLLSRDDVIVFTSEKLLYDLNIIGVVKSSLYVRADFDVTVHLMLLDLYPDGRSYNIINSCCIVSRSSKVKLIEIDLGNTAYQFKTNHFVQLAISLSRFPQYNLLNDNNDKVQCQFYCGSDLSSCLHLPVFDECISYF